MKNPEEEGVLSVAALGRPFQLGMLYDSRTEMLIPEKTLWDQASLENRTEQQLKSSELFVLCSDSLDKKASALEINTSLKLSLLCGLVGVEGAAKYLHSKRSSSGEQCITLQYKCITREESLTLGQLGSANVQRPEVFSSGTATHVVTNIVYGAQVFCTFVRKHSSSPTDHQKVEGNVPAIIQNIPNIKLNAKGEMDISRAERKKAAEFVCIFTGDLELPKNPASFLDAVKVYQGLAKLLGTGGENAVPLQAQLYPLTLIDRTATKLVQEIDHSLVSDIESFFHEMQELSIRCNDSLRSNVSKIFPDFRTQIQKFQNIIEICMKQTQKELCVMLPPIRDGRDEQRCLKELLNKINQSPVSVPALKSWLEKKSILRQVLDKYVSAMAGVKYITDPRDLEAEVKSRDNIYTLCLVISVPSNESQLETMKQYCLEEQSPNSCVKADDTQTKQKTGSRPMMDLADKFRDFYDANKSKKGISFLVAHEFSECDQLHAWVKCYKGDKLMSDNYELPSPPEKVQALVEDTTHDSVTISWSPPQYGAPAITYYVVSCCKDSPEQVTTRVSVHPDKNQVTIPGLAANTKYEVRVWGTCQIGYGPVGDAKVVVKTKPASPPQILRPLKASRTRFLLRWEAPACVADGCSVEQYVIKQETQPGHWEATHHPIPSNKFSCIMESLPNHVPSFKVAALCGSGEASCDSEPCTIDLTKPTTCEDLKEYICATSDVIENDPKIYKIEPKLISRNSKDMIDKYEYGERKFSVPEKVIMLVGATGSGKTTLINGFVNYIFGVEWKDPFRFKMILEPNAADQAMSQTTRISSYTLHHQEGFKLPYTLTIVDTPGFGDVSGIMRDKQITENIHKFFTTRGENGITHIDAVGFVANSSMPRLTPTQKYIFDQILSLFGKDIADNIFLLLTFADGKEPQVLSGIKKANIPYRKHFKFNNSALYARQCSTGNDGDDDGRSFDTMFWKMGVKSYDLFLTQLDSVETKSLILTQDVLTQRNAIQTSIEGIQIDIRQGLCTLERLKREMELLEKHHAEIERNKNFEYVVEEEIFEQVINPVGRYVTNCLKCNRTCHDNCIYADDEDKVRCSAMTDGECRICPNKCVWSVHKNMPHKYVLRTKKTKKTVKELLQKYEKATQRKLSTENLIEEINEEFKALQVKVLGMTHTVRVSIQRLEEIALRPNPMTTVEYLDILIETEKCQAEPGWQARLHQLTVVKQEAEYMEKIADQGFDPFKQYLENIESEIEKSNNGVFARGIRYIKEMWYETSAFITGKKRKKV